MSTQEQEAAITPDESQELAPIPAPAAEPAKPDPKGEAAAAIISQASINSEDIADLEKYRKDKQGWNKTQNQHNREAAEAARAAKTLRDKLAADVAAAGSDPSRQQAVLESFDNQWAAIKAKYQKQLDDGEITVEDANAKIEADQKALVKKAAAAPAQSPAPVHDDMDIDERIAQVIERRERGNKFEDAVSKVAAEIAKTYPEPGNARIKALLKSSLEEHQGNLKESVADVVDMFETLTGRGVEIATGRASLSPATAEMGQGPRRASVGVQSDEQIALQVVLETRQAEGRPVK